MGHNQTKAIAGKSRPRQRGHKSPIGRVGIAFVAFGMASLSVASAGSHRAGANPVTAPVQETGLILEVAPLVTLPDTGSGTAPRINNLTFQGQDLYVVEERDGLIYKISNPLTNPQRTMWFDVGQAIADSTNRELDQSNPVHGGLRSLAFHPDFLTNGRFYTSVLESRPGSPDNHVYISDAASPVAADSVLIEWQVPAATQTPDPQSYREVFRVGLPVYDHPIKGIAFNPNAEPADDDYGLLYVGHGDGSVASAVAGGGQNPDALGKILRINPLGSGTKSYSIPASNPFIADPAMPDEVYSLGHRNPHNLAFIRFDGEDVLLVADAGRDNVEEINIIVPGGDYGWPLREGTFVHLQTGGLDVGVTPLPTDEASTGFRYPAAQVGHTGPVGATFVGQAIAGGYAVDNGSELSGHYFYSDFPVSGTVFHSSVADLMSAVTSLDPGDLGRSHPDDLTQAATNTTQIHFDHDNSPSTPSLALTSLREVFQMSPHYETTRADVRFGQGPSGELYISSKRNNTIYLVLNSLPQEPPLGPIPSPDPSPEPALLPGLFESRPLHRGHSEVLRLYWAALGRPPERAGADFWLDAYDSGAWDTRSIASFFATSPEFRSLYGADLADLAFIEVVYQNVLGRRPDEAGHRFWTSQLGDGMAREEMILLVGNDTEFVGRTPLPSDATPNGGPLGLNPSSSTTFVR